MQVCVCLNKRKSNDVLFADAFIRFLPHDEDNVSNGLVRKDLHAGEIDDLFNRACVQQEFAKLRGVARCQHSVWNDEREAPARP